MGPQLLVAKGPQFPSRRQQQQQQFSCSQGASPADLRKVTAFSSFHRASPPPRAARSSHLGALGGGGRNPNGTSINPELLVGDCIVLTSFSLYKQIAAIVISPSFPGWLEPLDLDPVTFVEFLGFLTTLVGSWLAASLLTANISLSPPFPPSANLPQPTSPPGGQKDSKQEGGINTAGTPRGKRIAGTGTGPGRSSKGKGGNRGGIEEDDVPLVLRQTSLTWLVSMPVACAQLVLCTAAENGALVGEEGWVTRLPLAASGPLEPFVTAASVLGVMSIWRSFYTIYLNRWSRVDMRSAERFQEALTMLAVMGAMGTMVMGVLQALLSPEEVEMLQSVFIETVL